MRITREIQLIAGLLILIIVLIALVDFFKSDVEGADASNVVLEDLQSRYPEGDVSIMTIKQKQNNLGQQYFEVKAKVTLDYDTPCPERIHIYYNYPEQNFVSQPNEYITAGCQVCTEGICTLAFPEEAIIASHTFKGTEEIHDYVEEYPSAHADTSESNDSWIVRWNSALASFSYSVEISKNGKVLAIEKLE